MYLVSLIIPDEKLLFLDRVVPSLVAMRRPCGIICTMMLLNIRWLVPAQSVRGFKRLTILCSIWKMEESPLYCSAPKRPPSTTQSRSSA